MSVPSVEVTVVNPIQGICKVAEPESLNVPLTVFTSFVAVTVFPNSVSSVVFTVSVAHNFAVAKTASDGVSSVLIANKANVYCFPSVSPVTSYPTLAY